MVNNVKECAVSAVSLDYDVIIVGAGVSGLAALHNIRRFAPHLRATVLEKGSGVGGTWLWNTYPGAACDVPSHWYSFSFAAKTDWSRRFSAQEEIRAYLNQVAAVEGINFFQFNTKVDGATWDDVGAFWSVGLGGKQAVLRSRYLIAGPGALSTTATPIFPGATSFGGKSFHSGAWDHSVAIVGQRVGIIGTGCSAAQIVPAIAPTVKKLIVFQRTASWVSPRGDEEYSKSALLAFAYIPLLALFYRYYLAFMHDIRYFAFIRPYSKRLLAYAVKISQSHLSRGLRKVESDADRARLLDALTPRYALGCKRVITSDDFLPSFSRKNVLLETATIARITPTGIVVRDAASGRETVHALDVIVYATGFDVVASVDSLGVIGRGGHSMKSNFEQNGGPEAYLGLAVPRFPNLFMMMGPNTGLGHSSMISMIEAQSVYAAKCIARAEKMGWAAVEVRDSSSDIYNKEIQLQLRKNVWGSCVSWYSEWLRALQVAVLFSHFPFASLTSPPPQTDLQGAKNVVLWPFTVCYYHWVLSRIDWRAWSLRPADAMTAT